MNRKYRKRKTPRFFFIISLALFLFIGIGYSVINSNLSMQGNVVRKATTWSIGFADPVFDTGSITNPTPTITNGNTMNMSVNLINPGDIYAFTVDLKNTGSVPALINTLNITQLTQEQENYLRWKVEYEDESTPAVGDLLKAGETKKVHIFLEYKKLRATDLYPTSAVNINLTVSANFYLPEESFNTVTLTKNGSIKNIHVSNLEQEVTLDDFPIESTDQVIACNNGVEPSTDTNDKIVLSKIKQDATCRIEPSLASAVTNSSTEVTNMAILQDAITDTRLTIETTQNITLNLNKKVYTFTTGNDQPQLTVDGILKIKDDNKTGEMKTTQQRLLDCTGNSSCTITNAHIGRYNNSTLGSTIRGGGNFTIKQSIIDGDRAITLSAHTSNTNINVYNTTIRNNGNHMPVTIEASSTITNIYNSSIVSGYYIGTNIATFSNSKIYICNSTYTGTLTLGDYNNDNQQATYYYYNTTFKNGTLVPTISNNSNNNVKETPLACAE